MKDAAGGGRPMRARPRRRRWSWSWSAAPLLGGCAGPYNTFNAASADAQVLSGLGWWLCALMLLITVAMGVLLLWGARRRRGSLAGHLPPDAGGGKRWILIGGLALPTAVLTALFIVTLLTLRALAGKDEPVDLELRVTAWQWWWQVEYLGGDPGGRFEVANEIHIPVGARVGIRLLAKDVIHSFWVPRLHGKLDAIPGSANYLVLQADRAGVYPGQCAEYCGAQHTHMGLLVVAEEPAAYRAWAARQRRPAVAPATPALQRGLAAFEGSECAECHTIRGTRARGGKGPDLTHVGSRRTLGAGAVPNDRARLQGWIVDAPGIKPGVKMPPQAHFDGRTLNALAAYLESLQ